MNPVYFFYHPLLIILQKQDCKAYSPKLAAAFKVLVKSKGFLIGFSLKSNLELFTTI